MRFCSKLALFLIATLVAIQAATGFATYGLIRSALIDDGMGRLNAAAGQFTRQLAELQDQMAAGVKILTLDFALRQAIAQRDEATLVSALRNHGRRVGAARMMMLDTEGAIGADTAQRGDKSFPFPSLLDRAAAEGPVASVASLDGRPVWLVIVPVLAPVPIGFIAAEVPLDDALLARLRALSGLPQETGLVVADGQHWRLASGAINSALLDALPPPADAKSTSAPITASGRTGETLYVSTPLATAADSARVAVVLDYPLSDALRPYLDLITIVVFGLILGVTAAAVGAWLIARSVSRPLELLARHTSRIAAGDYAAPLMLNRGDEIGELGTALARMTDAIAEREDHIRYQASHDPVSGLPNRQSLADSIGAAMTLEALGQAHPGHAATQTGTGGQCAVIVLSLVRLQDVANTVGRELAERIVRDSGQRLATLCADAPLGCVAERSFAVFLHGDANAASALAESLVQEFDIPYREGDITIDTSAAAGIAIAPEHGTDAAQLLRRAEIAVHAAQKTDRRVAVYQSGTDPHRLELLSLMSELRRGLAEGELKLFFQPKIALPSRQLVGAEGLARWIHPKRGMIPPDSFIPLAEETGNIQLLTRFVLAAGIAQAAAWRRAGHSFRVALNISVRDLADAGLPGRIAALLAEHDLPAGAIELEITESAIMGEPDSAILVLRQIADLGVGLVIDDFGVGQSSLAYLKRLPVSALKIDKAFVLNLAHSADDRTIVRSIVDLGHQMGYRVTAERVEDMTSLDLLTTKGSDEAQGYAISRPIPAEDFERFAVSWAAAASGAAPGAAAAGAVAPGVAAPVTPAEIMGVTS